MSRSNSGVLFFLQRETNFMENTKILRFFLMSIEIATKFEALLFKVAHC